MGGASVFSGMGPGLGQHVGGNAVGPREGSHNNWYTQLRMIRDTHYPLMGPNLERTMTENEFPSWWQVNTVVMVVPGGAH